MNDIILFSPVGGTDPISMNNDKDGAMLHICRVYQVTKVILYMTSEILENQKKDDRYRYALSRLFEAQKREQVEIKEIQRPDLKNVQEFDFFYKEFREIMRSIYSQLDATDQLLINISSGTPAMKSGLLVLQTLGEFPATLIQVSTPVNGMNEHTHKDYDVVFLWEENEDNRPDFKNRCKEVACPTLSQIKSEEMIKRHIEVYDYQAAVAVAETMKPEDREPYFDLLKMAEARMLLDFSAVDKYQKTIGIDCLPVKSEDRRKYFEYALNLNIKLRRREYVDFIRGITPIMVDLFEVVLKRQCKINIENSTKEKNGVRRWDMQKLCDTGLVDILNQGYPSGFKGGPVYSDHLSKLILHYSEDACLKNLVKDLRKIEKEIRNMAAHQIVSITEEKIKK